MPDEASEIVVFSLILNIAVIITPINVINKKYLSKEDLELFNTEPTIIDRYNPF